jgi:hypothetical protein
VSAGRGSVVVEEISDTRAWVIAATCLGYVGSIIPNTLRCSTVFIVLALRAPEWLLTPPCPVATDGTIEGQRCRPE